jgi:hypothetical protein
MEHFTENANEQHAMDMVVVLAADAVIQKVDDIFCIVEDETKFMQLVATIAPHGALIPNAHRQWCIGQAAEIAECLRAIVESKGIVEPEQISFLRNNLSMSVRQHIDTMIKGMQGQYYTTTYLFDDAEQFKAHGDWIRSLFTANPLPTPAGFALTTTETLNGPLSGRYPGQDGYRDERRFRTPGGNFHTAYRTMSVSMRRSGYGSIWIDTSNGDSFSF